MSAITPLDEKARERSEQILAIYAGITAACMLAGVAASEAEDIAQDIWEWLLRSGNVEAAALAPWLAAVATNFVKRYYRRRTRETNRMRRLALESADARRDHRSAIEARLFLDRLGSRTGGADSKLLLLMRDGLRLSEAAQRLGIPKGSEQYHLRNLRKAAIGLRRPRAHCPTIS